MEPLGKFALLLLVGWGSIYFIWRSLLGGSSLILLLGSILTFVILSAVSLAAGLVTMILLLIVVVLALMRIAISPKYTNNLPTFETNKTIRGLNPIEAGYFAGLSTVEIFSIALFKLIDEEVVTPAGSNGDSLNINPTFIPNEIMLSSEGRKKFRDDAARKMKLNLSAPEHDILEMFRGNEVIQIEDFNSTLWHQLLANDLENLRNTFDFDKSREYALKIIEKTTSPQDEFSQGKILLSGWYAARIFSPSLEYEKNHHPEWLLPGDDFESYVIRLRDLLVSQSKPSAK